MLFLVRSDLLSLLILLISLHWCVAEPPQITDALTNVQLSRSTVMPGDPLKITWDFNPKYRNTIKSIEVWLGHSTGMGHGPYKAIKKNISPQRGATSVVIPSVQPSAQGNIWFIDLVWNNQGSATELQLLPITIR
ncbi:hypothetical protein K493DRAFT_311132, partial [Basidiobolus meristosporus CBS 931.73]